MSRPAAALMTEYDPARAARYWGEERFADGVDELQAVLCLNQPPYVAAAYARWETAVLGEYLGDLVGRTVLDLACGVGRISVELAARGASVIAADVAPGMLRRCRRRVEEAGAGDRVALVEADAGDLPLEPDSVDDAVCMGLFEHLPPGHRRRALDELGRVLRPGGRLVLEINNGSSIALDRCGDNPFRRETQLPNGYFCGLVDPEAIVEQLAALGFAIRERRSNPFFGALRYASRIASEPPDEELLARAYAAVADLDAALPSKGVLDDLLADQHLLLLELTAGAQA